MKGIKKVRVILVLMFLAGILSPVFSQQRTITGTVFDEAGQAMPGVNVIVKGTSTGASTDADGRFSIAIPPDSDVLTFSFIGFRPAELKLEGRSEISIVLVELIEELDELVVIGYGTQRKSDLTGAVSSVSSEELNSTASSNLTNALQGRAAGVYVQSTTGAPGSNVNIKIRGITSFNGTNPLWVVDGVPGVDPNTVNPSDIESFEVLKDASSAAIYGASGANGVVLVTTKKGKAGKTSVSFNAYFGVQKIADYLNVATGPQFGKMYTEYETIRRARNYTFPDYESLPNYNYQDEIFRTAPMQNYDLSISGGNEKSNFYFGMGYLTQEGIMKNSAYEKLTLRVNSESRPNNWLTVGENISFARNEYSGFEEWQLLDIYHTPVLSAINYHPFMAPYDSTGNWSSSPLSNTKNPVSMQELLHSGRQNYGAKATLFAKIEPIEGLSFETRITGGANFGNSYNFTPEFFITPSYKNTFSRILKNNSQGYNWLWQNILSYSKTFWDDHHLDLMAGFESGYGKSEWMQAERLDLINEDEEMWYFNASKNDTAATQIPTGAASENSGYSYFGRISYNYKGMILAQGNLRKDYSSRFGPRNRSGVFPSFSVGFKFSELDFMKNHVSSISFAKIRYGWGKVGNNAVPEYAYFSTIALLPVMQYPFAGETAYLGAGKDILANSSIAWEGVVTSNLGLDLRFLNNKLAISADYFSRKNEGMLLELPPPMMAGWYYEDLYWENNGNLVNPIANVGELSNSGVELTASWKDVAGKFSYAINGNFTYVTTKAVEIVPDTMYRGETNGFAGSLTRTIQGNPIGEYYGYRVEGLFQQSDAEEINGKMMVTNQPYILDEEGNPIYAQPNAAPGDYKFEDVNNDGKVDENDVVAIGNPNPKYLFGLNMDFSYGWFDLNMFWQGVAGNKIFNAVKYYQFNSEGNYNWSAEYIEDHYREDLYNREGELMFEANYDGKYPRLDPFNQNQNFRKSDFYMESGAYLRLKNLQIGMTIPAQWSRRIGIEKLRIYVSGNNLLTLTKYSGYDPEVGSPNMLVQGLDTGVYPAARIYMMGINMNF
jgi:TonB-dependent starch-binding outer membrane protein SusC